jgi:hypothetical protein
MLQTSTVSRLLNNHFSTKSCFLSFSRGVHDLTRTSIEGASRTTPAIRAAESLDKLDIPFALRQNKFYDVEKKEMFEVMVKYQLVGHDHLKYYTQFNLINKYFFPTCSADVLKVVSRIIDIFFLLDDIYDTDVRNGTNVTMVTRLINSTVQTIKTDDICHDKSEINLFVRDTFTKLNEIASPIQVRTLKTHFCDYLINGSLVMMKMWAQNNMPTYDEFCRIRDFDIAVLPAIALAEIAAKLAYSDEICTNEKVSRFRMKAVRHVGILNDILSYEKEVIRDNCPCNAVWVHQKEFQCDFNTSLQQLIQELNEIVKEMVLLREEISERFSPAVVDPYLDVIEDIVSGHYQWCIKGTRYNSSDSPIIQLRTSSEKISEKSKGLLHNKSFSIVPTH